MIKQTRTAKIVHSASSGWTGRHTNYFLWTVQTLLAALFVFAGGVKLMLPIEAMTRETLLPGWFLRWIGTFEILGAAGLILPWLLGIKRILTPLAASGLVLIMSGATIITLKSGDSAAAIMPFAVGILLSLVAYGRWFVLKPVRTGDQAGDVPAAFFRIA